MTKTKVVVGSCQEEWDYAVSAISLLRKGYDVCVFMKTENGIDRMSEVCC